MREHERNGPARLNNELTDCLEVFAVKFGWGPQHQTLRTGNRVDCAIIEPVDPRYSGPVVEAHHELSMELYTPGSPDHNPHEVGTVCGPHEIDDRRTAGFSLELSFDNESAGTIMPFHVARRMRWGNKPTTIFGCPQESGKARSRIKTGPAQPID